MLYIIENKELSEKRRRCSSFILKSFLRNLLAEKRAADERMNIGLIPPESEKRSLRLRLIPSFLSYFYCNELGEIICMW